jgi:hypothetical protein
MELGPFNISEIEYFKEIFTRRKVAYEILIDKDLEEQIMAEFHEKATTAPSAMAGQLDLRIVFFEVANEDFEKVKADFENYGVLEPSDGSYELGED